MKARLGDYIQEYSVRNKADEDIPVYSVTNTQGFCRDYFGKEMASKDKSTYKVVPRGCFAYNPSRINVGSVDWQRNEEKVIVSPLYNVFSVSSELEQQYLYYYLKSDVALHFIKEVATGSVRDNLKFDMLCDFRLNLPSLGKQGHIVQILDKVKLLIQMKQSELNKLDSLIKARFIEMFGNQEFPIISLDSIAEVTGGLTKNGKRKDMPMKYPYLRVANVYYNRLDLSEILEIGVKDNAEVEKALLKTDDLLFVEGNGSPAQIGRVALWNGSIEHCLHQNHLIKARLELSKVNPRYVLFYFMSEDGREQIANRAVSTSGLYTLSVSKVAGLVLPIPPIELQNEFDEFVKLTDKSKVIHINTIPKGGVFNGN